MKLPSPTTRVARTIALLLLGPVALAGYLLGAQAADPKAQTPPGADKTARTKMLEAGAALLQGNEPLDGLDVYLVGFHPMKDDPAHQMEAHHYCHQVNQDFAQCVLFDGNGADARMNGIEYIISEKLFETLPVEERRYWHPHDYEILSGQLVAPGIPDAAERALMKDKMNSYGKTWHVWSTGAPGDAGDPLPLGPAQLAWSFNRDGEAQPGLVAGRDERLGVSTDQKRKQREELTPLARPQCGVDALHGRFQGETVPVAGVVQRTQGCPAPEAAPASAAPAKPSPAAAAKPSARPSAAAEAKLPAKPAATRSASTR